MQAAWRALERRFGGLEGLVDAGAGVLRVPELRRDALEALVAHRALAVHVPGFIPPAIAADFARELLGCESRNWRVSRASESAESDVDAVGMPYNVAAAAGRLDDYHADAVPSARRLRRAEGPLAPLDRLRLELDELWPTGCLLRRDQHGRPFAPGLARVMRPPARFDPARWTKGFAHVDELDLLRPERGLFSANVYLQNAASGGELLLWPIAVRSRRDFYCNAPTLSLCLRQDAAAQRELWDRLPEPVVVRPAVGDLVIICTQRPHAVRGPIAGGVRVSLQGFLQHEQGRALRLEA